MQLFRRLAFILSALAAAMAPSAMRADETQPPRFEFLHLWGSGGEARSLEVLSDAMKERGVIWTEHSVYNTGHGVRRMLATRLASDLPPTSVFWHGGDSSDSMIQDGYFRIIPLQFGSVNFETVLRPEALEMVRYEDGVNVLPIGIHVVNRLLYNQEILDELGAAPAQSWREFLDLAKRAKAAGHTALIVSDQRWQNLYTMMSVLSENLTADEIERFIEGNEPPENYREWLSDAAEILIQLRDYINDDRHDLVWDTAIAKVYNKEGLAYVTGDFASALIPKDDGSVLCAASPGTSYIMWTLDAAALLATEDPRELAGQIAFAEIISDPEIHSRFIVEKGGVSVYKGANTDGLDSCTRASLEDWNSAQRKIFVPSEAWIRIFYLLADVTNSIWAFETNTADDAAAQASVALEAERASEEASLK